MAKAREEVTRLPFINSETLEKKKWNDRIVPFVHQDIHRMQKM